MESSNDIYFMVISITTVLVVLLCFIVFVMFIYRRRQRVHLQELKRTREQYDKEILRTQLEISEQTLNNISEEIHDNVGQVLSLAILHLSSIELPGNQNGAAKIENVTSLVEKAVYDLRIMSKTMDADNIGNLGLIAVIRFELDILEKSGIHTVGLEVSGSEQRLDPSKEIVVYRVFQQCQTNMIKHAKATTFMVKIEFYQDSMAMTLTDNGIGFDRHAMGMEQELAKKGAGLRNMQRRASLIGASFEVNSGVSAGTSTRLVVPYDSGNQ